MASEITELLERWREGDRAAFDELIPLVYVELHRIAGAHLGRHRGGDTLQPTALVNEACLKLLDSAGPQFANRSHFLAVMARAMRQVLVDHARAAAAVKRGGNRQRIEWDTEIEVRADSSRQKHHMLDLDRALDALERENPSLATVIEMHYFGGMTAEEVAEVRNMSAHAVRHEIRFARAWLRRELAEAEES